ncbi:MAG: hypothetical protein HY314_13590 [Acidobacteria bacterium]|nr:hypothetical protein [Acidobacteriota bacterium]
MNTSLVDIAKGYVESETPKRRERAEERLNQLRKKYGPGGGWRLIQPGPLWEACEIWLDETRQFGHAIVDHVLQQADARRLLGHPGEVENLRHFMYEWANREQEEYIMPSFQAFMAERGIKVDQQVGNTREQVEYRIAQATKEFLTKIFEAGQAARAAS